jgi:hypothetical protein
MHEAGENYTFRSFVICFHQIFLETAHQEGWDEPVCCMHDSSEMCEQNFSRKM